MSINVTICFCSESMPVRSWSLLVLSVSYCTSMSSNNLVTFSFSLVTAVT
ncbi:MAG: hypothetical protein IPI95_15565 [Flavobacteriales bacterium]|nr:hypothetical protein [Flavobacteriales bacterium]